MKNYAIAFAAGLLIWLLAAIYLHTETVQTEAAYKNRSQMTQRFEALRTLWSESAQKSALKRFETILRLYRIDAAKSRRNGRSLYRFDVGAAQADTVLGKILALPLAIASLTVRRKDDHTLHVEIGVGS